MFLLGVSNLLINLHYFSEFHIHRIFIRVYIFFICKYVGYIIDVVYLITTGPITII